MLLLILGLEKTIPIPSMYGIFTYIFHKNQPDEGKYAIHGWYGIHKNHSTPHAEQSWFLRKLLVALAEVVLSSSHSSSCHCHVSCSVGFLADGRPCRFLLNNRSGFTRPSFALPWNPNDPCFIWTLFFWLKKPLQKKEHLRAPVSKKHF